MLFWYIGIVDVYSLRIRYAPCGDMPRHTRIVVVPPLANSNLKLSVGTQIHCATVHRRNLHDHSNILIPKWIDRLFIFIRILMQCNKYSKCMRAAIVSRWSLWSNVRTLYGLCLWGSRHRRYNRLPTATNPFNVAANPKYSSNATALPTTI